MLYLYNPEHSPHITPFDTGILEDKRYGLVLTSNSMPYNGFYIRTPISSFIPKASVSIAICTYGRPESLNVTLNSLMHQTFKDFEVVLITEKGHLSELRDKGLHSASGRIVSFIDDDVYCPPTWLQGVVESFGEGILGVTGPTIISEEHQLNRDCFKYKNIRKLQEWLFKVPTTPSRLSVCGAPSMASNMHGCDYEGSVEYLECCNMSVLRDEAIRVGGFDHGYIKTSEWCELDLSKKLGNKGTLWFTTRARLEHHPSKSGIYSARLATDHRWLNFKKFQERWVKPSFRRSAYQGFVWAYFKVKNLGWVNGYSSSEENDKTKTGVFCPKDGHEMEAVSASDRYTCHLCGGIYVIVNGEFRQPWFEGF